MSLPDLLPSGSTSLEEVERYLYDELPPMQTGVMTGHGAGVRRAQALLHALGDPQESLRVVHVAGTAGKGSVCTFVSSILHEHGHRVGRYLSPHAHSVLERFGLEGAHVSADALAPVLREVATAERALRDGPDGRASMFEVTTATAFELFSRAGLDYAVVETGLGGLHDATNVVTRPDKLAVLTSIGLDHVDVLGPTHAAIARQKAGILPVGGEALAVRTTDEADEVVRYEARRRSTRLTQYDAADLARTLDRAAGRPVRLRLPGARQRENAGLAVRTCALLARRDGWRLDPVLVRAGLSAATLPGRFELRALGGYPVVLDGAHNPMKLDALVDAVRERFPGQLPLWIVAVKPDKDLPRILRCLAPTAQMLIATEFDVDDVVEAAPAAQVASLAEAAGIARVAASPRMADALAKGVALVRDGAPVVVTGSFHAVAAAGRLLGPSTP